MNITRLSGGSSPHTRGARHERRQRRIGAGIIPAYAGSTAAAPPAPTTFRDHPRIRGEHKVAQKGKGVAAGSSPHTRGALHLMDLDGENYGIIPAYAGSTVRRRRRRTSPWDHPRIRGEHSPTAAMMRCRRGSSPHTRGAHRCPHRLRDRAMDHPRIRGEHQSPSYPISPRTGSSPHTRGARELSALAGGALGIIPAYAGSTSASRPPT